MMEPGPSIPAAHPRVGEVAGLSLRFVGRLIDSIALVASLALGYALYNTPGASAASQAISRYLVVLLFWFANDVALTSITGGSLGKMICGTRVVRGPDREPLSFATASLRWVVMVLLTIVPLGAFADALMILSGKDNQTIHDRVANTFVVRVR